MPPEEDPTNQMLNRLLDFHADMTDIVTAQGEQKTLIKVQAGSIKELWTKVNAQGELITQLRIRMAAWAGAAGLAGGLIPYLLKFIKGG